MGKVKKTKSIIVSCWQNLQPQIILGKDQQSLSKTKKYLTKTFKIILFYHKNLLTKRYCLEE